MTTSAKTGISLEFFLEDVSVSEYFYKDKRVFSEAVEVEVSVEDYSKAIKNIDQWIKKIENTVNSQELVVGVISTNVDEKLFEENGEIKLKLEIGDIELEVKYNISTKLITVTRSAYDLSWTDFLHFISRYRDFISIYIASYV